MDLKDNIYFAIVLSVHSYMTSALFAFCLGLSNNPPAIYMRQLSSYPELHGCMFIDNEGNVAVSAAHDWKLDDTTGYQTCLIKASIDSRVFKYPES